MKGINCSEEKDRWFDIHWKLIFEDGKYRTRLNEAVALMGQIQQEFGIKESSALIYYLLI